MTKVVLMGVVLLVAACAAPAPDTFHTATKAQIQPAVVGHTVTFSDGLVLDYKPDGGYVATSRGQVDKGNYTINDNGTICVKFIPTGERCDTILTDGSSFILVNKDGKRFSMTIR